MTTFSAETFQNEFLSEGTSEVNAIVTVSATSDATPVAASGTRGEIIIVDCSGSMQSPGDKMRQARNATKSAIDTLDDGVLFAIIAGTDSATPVYPYRGMVPASAQSREEAKRAVSQLTPGGGTAMSQWLRLAGRLFDSASVTLAHAILLTDGKNEGEGAHELTTTLSALQGRFQADCRGVGTDWEVAELRRIAQNFLGTVDIVADPADLAADFEAMVSAAMGKATADVALRVWAPQGSTLNFVKQVAPQVEDITSRGVPVNALAKDYPTGAWGVESRDYHVSVSLHPGAVGAEMLAARISLVVDGEVQTQSLVKAIWTDDLALSTRINREVAHYTGQAELAEVIQEGLEARKNGDEDTATAKFGRAAQLAVASGNDDTQKLLAKVVDIEDAATGTVRLKKKVDAADEMALDTRSTKTVRVGR